MNRSDPTDVVVTQPLGITGWLVEGIYVAGAFLLAALLGAGPIGAGAAAVAAAAIRLGIFTRGRRVRVTPDAVRIGSVLVPAAHVRGVEELDAQALRARARTPGPGFAIRSPGGRHPGVAVATETPEGIAVEWLLSAADPGRLADAIDGLVGSEARPAQPTGATLPFRGRQGLHLTWLLAALAVAAMADVLSVMNGLVPVVTPAVAVVAGWTGLRRVRIDDEGVRVGTYRTAWSAVRSARVVSAAEAAGIQVRRSRNPPWGAPWVLILVEDIPGEDRWRQASAVGIPTAVQLPVSVAPRDDR